MGQEELCAYFSQLDLAGYRPGSDDTPVLTAAGKTALLKLLKKSVLVFSHSVSQVLLLMTEKLVSVTVTSAQCF